MTPITLAMMQKLWPHGNSKVPGLIEGIVSEAPRVLAKWGITSDLVVEHALAQFSHECGAGTEMTENRHYSAERSAEVWPLHANDKAAFRHFANATDCYRKAGSFVGDPDFTRKLLNLVYGTRMGNIPGTDDGYNLVGRGFPQTTGHDGYDKLGKKMGKDFLNHPDDVNLPENAFECGIVDFILCGCVPYALQDNLLGVSSMLNVGHLVSNPHDVVGYAERSEWLALVKRAFTAAGATPAAASAPTVAQALPALGSVQWAKHALNHLGFGPLTEDGKKDVALQNAVLQFQKSVGFTGRNIDGMLGPKTNGALATRLSSEGT